MKIAFASKNGKHIDAHFGQCQSFSVFELNEMEYKWLESRAVYVDKEDEVHDARIGRRVEAISDCTLLFVCSIGNEASKQMIKAGIMILKVEPDSEIITQMDELLKLLQEGSPLWLVNAMRRSGERGD